MTLIRCLTCDTEWEMDYMPVACTCQGQDAGWWQISEDGNVWTDQDDLFLKRLEPRVGKRRELVRPGGVVPQRRDDTDNTTH